VILYLLLEILFFLYWTAILLPRCEGPRLVCVVHGKEKYALIRVGAECNVNLMPLLSSKIPPFRLHVIVLLPNLYRFLYDLGTKTICLGDSLTILHKMLSIRFQPASPPLPIHLLFLYRRILRPHK